MTEILVHTGQHYDLEMSDIFFTEMGIPKPDHMLNINRGSHGAMTGRMLENLEPIVDAEAPDAVLVYGDTNSTLAGAVVAAKLGIPVAHVEAGLRSFNRAMPEEINRVLTDHCADLLLPPTDTAFQHLRAEGIAPDRIVQVGDVMYDTALMFSDIVTMRGLPSVLEGLAEKHFVLATIHRQENTDDPARLSAVIGGLSKVAAEMPVVCPLHPRTRQRLIDFGLEGQLEKITIVPPLGYLDVVACEMAAAVIATDSGGMQKEAFFHRTPCVTLRDETEWVELVAAGWNRVVPPTDADTIAAAILAAVGTTGADVAPYGDGHSRVAILKAVEAMLA
ncbi:UDP-N-acetylglucosamine 2-epimerase (non-hydrolyzing) [uncultured Tateyamaria sp.]|uniref:non-hydrolyzing UDP-N-acetylglucosamine 2-epimerase n=1 Tax=uncultured Tateyamaria sp. TaxID=455651 RepID=UPI002609D247|nr:UDP-N-acetylglucosamine 2-epimerase (non-hydrolyzing) [uncultured Tateyamaria sp.]